MKRETSGISWCGGLRWQWSYKVEMTMTWGHHGHTNGWSLTCAPKRCRARVVTVSSVHHKMSPVGRMCRATRRSTTSKGRHATRRETWLWALLASLACWVELIEHHHQTNNLPSSSAERCMHGSICYQLEWTGWNVRCLTHGHGRGHPSNSNFIFLGCVVICSWL